MLTGFHCRGSCNGTCCVCSRIQLKWNENGSSGSETFLLYSWKVIIKNPSSLMKRHTVSTCWVPGRDSSLAEDDDNNKSEFAALPGSQRGPGGDPVLLCPQSRGRWSRRRAARAERRDRTRRSPAEMTSTSMTTRSALGQVSTQSKTETEREWKGGGG